MKNKIKKFLNQSMGVEEFRVDKIVPEISELRKFSKWTIMTLRKRKTEVTPSEGIDNIIPSLESNNIRDARGNEDPLSQNSIGKLDEKANPTSSEEEEEAGEKEEDVYLSDDFEFLDDDDPTFDFTETEDAEGQEGDEKVDDDDVEDEEKIPTKTVSFVKESLFDDIERMDDDSSEDEVFIILLLTILIQISLFISFNIIETS